MTAPRPRGRPAGSTDPDARKGRIYVRVNKDEREKMDRLAAMHNLAVSEWLRRRGLMLRVKK